jgi:hypothetical protein
MEKEKQLKIGELVQIWDHNANPHVELPEHGSLGYVVGPSKDPKHRSAGAYRIICFGKGDDPSVGRIVEINKSWLNPIDKFSDIKKVEDE